MSTSEHKLSIQPCYILVERSLDYEIVSSKYSEMLKEISVACLEAGCRKVLVLGPKTKVKLSVADIYELGQEIAKLGLQIAVVELHDASDKEIKFLENVVHNRGVPIQFFDNQQDAKEWLDVL